MYTALADDRFIRRLMVREGTGGQIERSLSPASFANNPTYHALSYPWGNPSIRSRGISVDGKPVRVFLEFVQRPICSALCTRLNFPCPGEVPLGRQSVYRQADDYERSQQVTKMKDIYSRAKEFVIWLGEAADNRQLAMRFTRGKRRRRWLQQWKRMDPLQDARRWSNKEFGRSIAHTLFIRTKYDGITKAN